MLITKQLIFSYTLKPPPTDFIYLYSNNLLSIFVQKKKQQPKL